MFEICVEHTFAAGHALRNYHGKCENVHGHNYRVQVAVEGAKLDENGLLHDFADLKPFDALNPSAENIAWFICSEIQQHLKNASISFVKVWETDTSCATYRP